MSSPLSTTPRPCTTKLSGRTLSDQERGSRNSRRWATGCSQGPIHVAVLGEPEIGAPRQQRFLAAQLFCFARVEVARGCGVIVPESVRRGPRGLHFFDVAIVRWLGTHRTCTSTDKQGRGVCPTLPANHALWSYAAATSPRFRFETVVDQLQDAGVHARAWMQEHGKSMFDVVSTNSIAHCMNVGLDPDTGGLLETISMPGMQTDQ